MQMHDGHLKPWFIKIPVKIIREIVRSTSKDRDLKISVPLRFCIKINDNRFERISE